MSSIPSIQIVLDRASRLDSDGFFTLTEKLVDIQWSDNAFDQESPIIDAEDKAIDSVHRMSKKQQASFHDNMNQVEAIVEAGVKENDPVTALAAKTVLIRAILAVIASVALTENEQDLLLSHWRSIIDS